MRVSPHSGARLPPGRWHDGGGILVPFHDTEQQNSCAVIEGGGEAMPSCAGCERPGKAPDRWTVYAVAPSVSHQCNVSAYGLCCLLRDLRQPSAFEEGADDLRLTAAVGP